MKLPVSDRGLLIPKELLGKIDEVEVTVQGDRIIITLGQERPSIWDLGSDPVECDVTDAAIEHDRYLYGLTDEEIKIIEETSQSSVSGKLKISSSIHSGNSSV